MARGKKLKMQTVYNIMTSYIVTGSYTETSRLLNIPISTVQRVVETNRDKPEFVNLRKQKKGEFSEKSSAVLDMLLEAIRQKAEKLLTDEKMLDKTKLTEITTAIGTLYDKMALTQGESTTTVSFILPEEVKKFVV